MRTKLILFVVLFFSASSIARSQGSPVRLTNLDPTGSCNPGNVTYSFQSNNLWICNLNGIGWFSLTAGGGVGTLINVTATPPIVVVPDPITKIGTVSCPSCGTGSGNVTESGGTTDYFPIFGTSPTTIVNSHMFDTSGTITSIEPFVANGLSSTGTTAGCLALSELPANGTDYSKICARDSIATATTWLWPAVDAVGVLASDGLGSLGFASYSSVVSGGGGLTGTVSSPYVTKATGAGVLGNSQIQDNGTNPTYSPLGFDVETTGYYAWGVANNGSTGTSLNHMACDDGIGKAIICSTTVATNNPFGTAVNGVNQAPGTTGNTGICSLGYCTVTFDNASVANHFAQMSATVAGDLHDVGTTAPTDGLPYWTVSTGNASPGLAIIRQLAPSELLTGGASGVVQVNGANTKRISNFNGTTPTAPTNGKNVAFTTSSSGNTSSISAAIVGNGNAATYLDGTGNYTTPGGGSVTATSPLQAVANNVSFIPQTPGLFLQTPPAAGGATLISYAYYSGTNITTPSFSLASDEQMIVQYKNGASTISDSQLNTFSAIVADTGDSKIYWVSSPAGGSDVITCNSCLFLFVTIFKGISSLDALSPAGACTTGSLCTYNVTTTQPNDLLFYLSGSVYSDHITSAGYTVLYDNLSTSDPDTPNHSVGYSSSSSAGVYTAQSTEGGNCTIIVGQHCYGTLMAFVTSGGGNTNPVFLPANFEQSLYSITLKSQTALIADTTILTPSSDQTYRFTGTLNCTNNAVANGTPMMVQAIRAQASTAITWGVSVAGLVPTLNLKYKGTNGVSQTVSISDTCVTSVSYDLSAYLELMK